MTHGQNTADEFAIRSLVARYCDAVLRRDADAWGATWATDSEWRILGNTTRGREETVALWKTLMESFSFVMQTPGAGWIEIDGDRANGRWSISEYAKATDGRGILTLGIYRDEYCRQAPGWLFRRRRFDLLYSGPPDLSAAVQPLPGDL